MHAENRNKVFEEASRVLRPGGRIIISEYTLREDPQLNHFEQNYLEPWLKGWAMPKLLTPPEFRSELSGAGFTDVQIVHVTDHVRPSLRRLQIFCILIYPIMLLIAPLFFRKERLENYYASWRQISALTKNIWRYSIIKATKN